MAKKASEEAREALVTRLAELIEHVPVQVRSRSDLEWSHLDLTMRQARTLFFLSEGPKRVTDISAHVDRGMAAVSGMIDRLVKKGLARRLEDPKDKRVVTCELTELGAEVADRFWRIGSLKIEAIAELLSTDELRKVVTAMQILSNAIETRAHAEPGAGAKRPTTPDAEQAFPAAQ